MRELAPEDTPVILSGWPSRLFVPEHVITLDALVTRRDDPLAILLPYRGIKFASQKCEQKVVFTVFPAGYEIHQLPSVDAVTQTVLSKSEVLLFPLQKKGLFSESGDLVRSSVAQNPYLVPFGNIYVLPEAFRSYIPPLT